MKIFDEAGNFIGEFIADAKENVSDSFEISWILGILCFLWQPIWTIVVIAILPEYQRKIYGKSLIEFLFVHYTVLDKRNVTRRYEGTGRIPLLPINER